MASTGERILVISLYYNDNIFLFLFTRITLKEKGKIYKRAPVVKQTLPLDEHCHRIFKHIINVMDYISTFSRKQNTIYFL